MLRWLDRLAGRSWRAGSSPPPAYDPALEPEPLGDVFRRGEAAHRLLNDPTLAEAFKSLREDLYAQWFATEPEQKVRREELYFEAKALEKVTNKLITYRGAARMKADREARSA